MKNPPAFQFYARDWLADLAEQYAAAHGATIEWRDRND